MERRTEIEEKFLQYFNLRILEVSDVENGNVLKDNDRGVYAWFYLPPADWPSKNLLFRGSSLLREIKGHDLRSKESVDIEWKSGVVEDASTTLDSIERSYFKYASLFCSMPLYVGRSVGLRTRLKTHVRNLRKACDKEDFIPDYDDDDSVKVFTGWLKEYIESGVDSSHTLHPEHFVVMAFVAADFIEDNQINAVEEELIKLCRPLANKK